VAFRSPSFGRPRLLLPVLATLAALIVLLLVFTSVWTDLLFYREVHYTGVFRTVLATRVLLFLVGGLVVAAVACGNAVIAYRSRPPFRPASLEQQNLDRYRMVLEPRLVLLLVALGGLLTLAAGAAAQSHWQTVLLWEHQQSFGHQDPQFHRDVSYYVFTYPMQRLVLDLGFQAVLLGIVAASAVHYLFGGIRLQTPGDKLVPAAKAHLAILLGVFVLLKAIAYYLDRFGLNYSTRGVVETGASATDITAVLPGKTFLVGISVLCAVLFFASARLRGWLLPGIALGLLVLAAVIIGGVVPAAYQQFSVKPNEVSKESKYIQRSIVETRYAYQLAGVTAQQVDPAKADRAGAAADAANLSSVRLLDPNVLGPTYDQLQQIRNYYAFPKILDIDRYTDNGALQDYVVAAREVDQTGLTAGQQNWINQHLTFTHGNGLVAAPASTVTAAGRPDFDRGEKDIPPVGALGLTQDGSRIYYGEQAPAYSVVRTKQKEVDGPGADGSSTDASQQTTNSYAGKGGVPVSGINKLLFALRFSDTNLLLSSAITSDSRILYYRQPRDRVQKVAPWLRLDGDPYPTVVGGRVLWVLDGYTSTDKFPYSSLKTLGALTADSQNTQTGANNAQQTQDQVNYIRNSVKATVDAEDGTVRLYDVDPTDPILKAWEGVFPHTVLDRALMPAGLTEHLRYPEDLFKVQRDLLAEYHVTDPAAFYSKTDFWTVPDDPTTGGVPQPQPPYYVVSKLPGQDSPQFNLTTTFVPQGGRKNLAAFFSVSSGGTASTSTASAYGAFTLLQLPTQSTVDGVPQAQQDFDSYGPYSQDKTLFSQGGSRVIQGNLLALPVGGGILYVEPVYLTGSSGAALPQLRRVLTSYNGVIGYAPDLPTALRGAFATAAPPVAGTTPSAGATAGPTSPTGTAPTGTAPAVSPSVPPPPTVAVPGGALPSDVPGLAAQLQAALVAQQQAAAGGDYTRAAAEQRRVTALVAQLGRIAGQTAATPPGGPPAPSPAASATP